MEQTEDFLPFVQSRVAGRVATVGEQIAQVRGDPGEEPVHDLRVVTRRALYALDLFRVLLEGPQFRRLRKRLRAVVAAGGTVRDRDVALALVASAGLSPSCELARALAVQRDVAAASLFRELERKRYRGFADRWSSRIRDMNRRDAGVAGGQAVRQEGAPRCPDWDPGASLLANAVRVLPGEVVRYLSTGRETSAGDQSPEALHRLRLAGKRLRYTLELFHETYGPRLQVILSQLKTLQDSLGGISDLDATGDLLRNTGLAAVAGGPALLTEIRSGRDRRLRTFSEDWRRLTESDPHRSWTGILEFAHEGKRREG